jgi:hypothetical protein
MLELIMSHLVHNKGFKDDILKKRRKRKKEKEKRKKNKVTNFGFGIKDRISK